jgi:pyruvate/2-oxoglutarate dehydrogenase complex dihydrolipoamide acyltransferase (E2) component
MAFEFKLPDLGEGVQEGEIVRWLVREGDVVAPEQPMVEVMTDKVTAELPSPVAGTVLKLHGQPGDIVPVESVLVVIENGEAPAPAAPSGNGMARSFSSPSPSASAEVPTAVPAVRRLAKELGVDLAAVVGTGTGGRVTEQDVRAAVTQPEPAAPRRVPLRGVRRVIAEHMLQAQRLAAPYTFVEEVDFTDLVSLRGRVQPIAEKAGVRITYLPFIMAAVSMALREHPTFNATSDPETGDLLVSDEQHVGVAVHTDAGLVVPVIRNVERRNLLDLAREVERLSQAARHGKLTREDLHGGTFSLTSLGPRGGVMGTPILNTPQVAVLGVHRIAPRPVVHDGAIVARQMGNISLTLDHRYIDGYVAAGFAQTLKQYLEDPALMMFWLAEFRGG